MLTGPLFLHSTGYNWAQNAQVELLKQGQHLMEKITTDMQEMNQKMQPLTKEFQKQLEQKAIQLQSTIKDLEARIQQMQHHMAPYAQEVCQRFCPVPSS